MSKTYDSPMKRVHLMLREDDWKFLMEQYDGNLGAGAAAREIIHAKVLALREAITRRRDQREAQARGQQP